jgi:tripartite-type tricarboxylate transporter receptor subunit TctC
MVARAPNTFAVNPAIPVTSLRELIEHARRNPGKLRYGSPGLGSNPHLSGELFGERYAITLVHVPYKGGGAGIADVISGQIEMIVTSFATAAGRVKAGQIRALAVTGAVRTPLMPEVPTMAEAGVPDFVLGALFGVFVPAGTPREPIERVTRDVRTAMAAPEFAKRMVDIGQELTEPLAGEDFGRVIRAEAARWRELASKAGVKDE